MIIVQENFQSIHQLLKTLDERENNAVLKGKHSSESEGHDFTLTNSYEEATQLLRFGYTDILSEIKVGMKQQAKFQETARKRKMQTAVYGYAPHVPNALLGVPNAMIYHESTTQKTKAISLVYAITASAREGASNFVKAGVALLSMIHALEIRGFRVQLKCLLFSACCGKEFALASVKLKGYGEHLDLQKLCFPIAHPSMFRRFGFKWLETVPNLTVSGWSSGYGRPIANHQFADLKGVIKENEYLLTLRTIQECNHNVDKLIEHLNLK